MTRIFVFAFILIEIYTVACISFNNCFIAFTICMCRYKGKIVSCSTFFVFFTRITSTRSYNGFLFSELDLFASSSFFFYFRRKGIKIQKIILLQQYQCLISLFLPLKKKKNEKSISMNDVKHEQKTRQSFDTDQLLLFLK